MKPAFIRLAFVFLCGATAAPAAAQASPQVGAHSPAPDDWLRRNDGESLLRFLLADGVFSGLESAQLGLGVERTCALVTPLFEGAVRDLRPAWTRMFRRVAAKYPYRPGHRGRETQLFLAVGLESVDLLQPKVEAITDPVLAESARVDPDAIDYEAAFARLSEARAQGRASCGLRSPVSRAQGPTPNNGVN